ncbi:hypothetical protein HFO63_28105 [Rhizobium laguerreae]|uniref:hypothetical protein n=1 Tax=Rhizobium laguerreae TaxID=1076926 RepID=UPI001C919151|nr:hypothetical protein [Rhizobium laguerreae]MBY3088413.1 hypothetical protein [Rhizobium laguerreae]MBY3149393.1 hypothetical protein [Rhizobium laguerreae]
MHWRCDAYQGSRQRAAIKVTWIAANLLSMCWPAAADKEVTRVLVIFQDSSTFQPEE